MSTDNVMEVTYKVDGRRLLINQDAFDSAIYNKVGVSVDKQDALDKVGVSVDKSEGQDTFDMYAKVREALSNLDVSDDSHWTQDGRPNAKHLTSIVGRSVKVIFISENFGSFSRSNPIIEDVLNKYEQV